MLNLIQAAGWPIWPLFFTSILALALIVERFIALRSKKIIPANLVEESLTVMRNRQVTPELIDQLEQNSPLGRVLAAGVRYLTLNPQATREEANATMEEAGRHVAHDLEKYLNALGTIATAAPLMGLFGTVVGMIEIFGSQSSSGTNPQQLAHGISVALYNTAFGLVIAIPALVFWRLFRRRVDDYVVELQYQAAQFLERALPIRRSAQSSTPLQANPANTQAKV